MSECPYSPAIRAAIVDRYAHAPCNVALAEELGVPVDWLRKFARNRGLRKTPEAAEAGKIRNRDNARAQAAEARREEEQARLAGLIQRDFERREADKTDADRLGLEPGGLLSAWPRVVPFLDKARERGRTALALAVQAVAARTNVPEMTVRQRYARAYA